MGMKRRGSDPHFRLQQSQSEHSGKTPLYIMNNTILPEFILATTSSPFFFQCSRHVTPSNFSVINSFRCPYKVFKEYFVRYIFRLPKVIWKLDTVFLNLNLQQRHLIGFDPKSPFSHKAGQLSLLSQHPTCIINYCSSLGCLLPGGTYNHPNGSTQFCSLSQGINQNISPFTVSSKLGSSQVFLNYFNILCWNYQSIFSLSRVLLNSVLCWVSN